jgi:desumoylating isopeptidase 1
LGFTEIPEDMFMELMRDLKDRFNMNNYNVMTNNCNNFTNEAAELLLGQGIPHEIVNLPQEFLATPMGRSLAPMMTQMQDSFKLSSNTLFNEEGQQ